MYIGSGLGSLSIAMAQQIGWRNTCHAVGDLRLSSSGGSGMKLSPPSLSPLKVAIYGFILAIVTALAVDPWPGRDGRARARASSSRKARERATAAKGAAEPPGCCEALATLLRSKLIVLLFAAGSVRFMAGYAIASFLPEFYATCFPEHLDL